MKYFIYTKLQSDSWETDNKAYDHLGDAMREVEKLYEGPLGRSCMYEIHDDENGVVKSSAEMLRWLRGEAKPGVVSLSKKTKPKEKPRLPTPLPGNGRNAYTESEVDSMLRSMYHIAFGDAVNPANRRTYRVEEALKAIKAPYKV